MCRKGKFNFILSIKDSREIPPPNMTSYLNNTVQRRIQCFRFDWFRHWYQLCPLLFCRKTSKYLICLKHWSCSKIIWAVTSKKITSSYCIWSVIENLQINMTYQEHLKWSWSEVKVTLDVLRYNSLLRSIGFIYCEYDVIK